MNVPNFSVGLFAEADQSTLTRARRSNALPYASSGCRGRAGPRRQPNQVLNAIAIRREMRRLLGQYRRARGRPGGADGDMTVVLIQGKGFQADGEGLPEFLFVVGMGSLQSDAWGSVVLDEAVGQIRKRNVGPDGA